MTEDYIRPPIVATEPRSRRAGTWRFRAVMLVLLAALAVGAFFLARAIIDSGQNGNAQGAPPPVPSKPHKSTFWDPSNG